MRVKLSSVLTALAAAAAGAVIAAAVVLYAGFYNIAATHQHLRPTYWVLQTGLRESIERHARDVEVPPLDARAAERGLPIYRDHCAQCHGAPGVAPEPFALGLTPLPTNLAYAARERSTRELYWVIKHGIKMTGMPAWSFRLADEELWAVVAFVRQLPALAPDEYRRRASAATQASDAKRAEEHVHAEGDAGRGKVALMQYACTTCHRIPGIVGPHAPVGPPLDRIGSRHYIAGTLWNTPENMVLWLRAPQTVNPRSAMPDLGVSAQDAADIAAYLYTLR
jgi:mono/diheme cytochrome c family protein